MFHNFKRVFFTAAVACAVIASVSGAATAADLKILVVDQEKVLRLSLAGLDVDRQGKSLRDVIKSEIEGERAAITTAERDLIDNAQIYSPAQREQKADAIELRKRQYAVFEQRRGQVLQFSMARASNEVAGAMRPILQSIIDERGANLLLDRQAAIYADTALDITEETITKLNEVIQTVKVERISVEDLAAIAAEMSKNASAAAPNATKPNVETAN